ncbi:MAG TPA: HU family DNA-binding protein [Spirochaetota bacterium]|nr:HU family DNA-binding protein [Spirochaetota bacterium]HPI90843.1 HU family DNA-binding protein [Spirochaetota bacterium]HPR49870.1 HU family DNA-binding protein [Spirochaetota bacterium]
MATKNNKTKLNGKITSTAMAQHIAEKHQLPKKQAKEIIEDLFDVIHAGVMKGERVPIGKFGKIHIRVKPATKARKGRNPLTGQEITIPAKKATKVPKFTFAKNFKEEAIKAKISKN